MNIAIYLMSLVGLTLILSLGEIFDYPKQRLYEFSRYCQGWTNPEHTKTSWCLNKLFEFLCCPQCMGFWIGFIAALIVHPMNSYCTNIYVNCFLDGCIVSEICYIVANLKVK